MQGPDCCSDYAVSFHYVPPNMMYVFDYLVYQLKPYGIVPQLVSPLHSSTINGASSIRTTPFNRNTSEALRRDFSKGRLTSVGKFQEGTKLPGTNEAGTASRVIAPQGTVRNSSSAKRQADSAISSKTLNRVSIPTTRRPQVGGKVKLKIGDSLKSSPLLKNSVSYEFKKKY